VVFSRVADLGARSVELLGEATRQRGNAAQPAQKIQRGALACQNGCSLAGKVQQQFAVLYQLAVFGAQVHEHPGVELFEN